MFILTLSPSHVSIDQNLRYLFEDDYHPKVVNFLKRGFDPQPCKALFAKLEALFESKTEGTASDEVCQHWWPARSSTTNGQAAVGEGCFFWDGGVVDPSRAVFLFALKATFGCSLGWVVFFEGSKLGVHWVLG